MELQEETMRSWYDQSLERMWGKGISMLFVEDKSQLTMERNENVHSALITPLSVPFRTREIRVPLTKENCTKIFFIVLFWSTGKWKMTKICINKDRMNKLVYVYNRVLCSCCKESHLHEQFSETCDWRHRANLKLQSGTHNFIHVKSKAQNNTMCVHGHRHTEQKVWKPSWKCYNKFRMGKKWLRMVSDVFITLPYNFQDMMWNQSREG